MKIITCAGYFNTGSTAITDFFTEFDNIKSLGETEFRFLQDPDGVQALETNLIDHPHRHNTSHAIKRFLKASKFENGNIFSKRYRRVFGDNYMRLTKEYINNITQLISPTHWRYDYIERGELFYMIDALVSVITSKFGNNHRVSLLNLTGELGYFTGISREDFYTATKQYTSSLFDSLGEGYDYLMVDQLVPPTDVTRYLNYVNDLYVITVERDPRDIYILVREIKHYSVLPHNVADFCKWFKITRQHRKTDPECKRNLMVHFEDIIYDYDNTANKLMDFIGEDISHHIAPFTKLNPEISIKNSRLWTKTSEFEKEIKYIEKELKEYLYEI